MRDVPIRYFTVGDFYDDTTRLLCPLTGYADEVAAKVRMDEILAQQRKPHHVEYRIMEARSWRELEALGVKI